MAFDWKLTVKKFGIVLVEVLVSGTIMYLTDNNYYIFLIPFLEATRNVLKHKTEIRFFKAL